MLEGESGLGTPGGAAPGTPALSHTSFQLPLEVMEQNLAGFWGTWDVKEGLVQPGSRVGPWCEPGPALGLRLLRGAGLTLGFWASTQLSPWLLK